MIETPCSKQTCRHGAAIGSPVELAPDDLPELFIVRELEVLLMLRCGTFDVNTESTQKLRNPSRVNIYRSFRQCEKVGFVLKDIF